MRFLSGINKTGENVMCSFKDIIASLEGQKKNASSHPHIVEILGVGKTLQ